MVSDAIWPFPILSKLVVPLTEKAGEVEAIIDTGGTRCLISLPTVLKLGIRMKTMAQPIRFKQVNGSLIVGASATLLTEPVRLGTHPLHSGTKNDESGDSRTGLVRQMGPHPMNGAPSHEGDNRKLRLGVGPTPPPGSTMRNPD